MKLSDFFRRKPPRRNYRSSSPIMRDYRAMLDAEERAFSRFMRMRETILNEMRELKGEDSFERTVDNIRRLREVEAELGNGKESHWWEALAQVAAIILSNQGSGMPHPQIMLPPVRAPKPTGSPEPMQAAPPESHQQHPQQPPASISQNDVTLMAWQFVLADALASDVDIDLVAEMLAARVEKDDNMRVFISQFLSADTRSIFEHLKRINPTLSESVIDRIDMLKLAFQGDFA